MMLQTTKLDDSMSMSMMESWSWSWCAVWTNSSSFVELLNLKFLCLVQYECECDAFAAQLLL
jgi:hypothetical protein